jgi:hypothetical protein
MAFTLFLSLTAGAAFSENLNPEGVNPHVDAPRKRISQEQKKAAAEARKKKKAEIDARKAAGQPSSQSGATGPGMAPAGSDNIDNKNLK